MNVKFDTWKMIRDLGGASSIARRLGICRTSPYTWARRGGPSSATLRKIKAAYPDANLDAYFVVGGEQ